MTLDPRRPGDLDLTRALSMQLELIWSYAEEHVLPGVDEQLALWRPCENSIGVRQRDGRWSAEMPDESRLPIPEPTVGWLLWHIEWWWTNAGRTTRGDTPLAPDKHAWSGSAEGVRAAK